MPALLYLIALGNLVVGSSAFVVSGIVDLIAHDLGTSLSAAGQAMTAYALATALGAPVLVAATGRWPRKRALLVALAIFTVGNATCALAAGLPQLYAGRLLMGLGSMFTPIGAAVAIASVAPARRGQALSTAFLGMSLSYVVGVPLGAWLGRQHGWQAAIWLMTAASAAVALVAAWRVPTDVQAPGADFSGLGLLLRRPPVLAALATTGLYFAAIFTVFSYIAPVHRALVPGSVLGLSWTLTLFGLAGVGGTLLGGWASDRFGPHRAMQVLLLSLVLSMAALPLTRGHEAWFMGTMLVWGASGFGLMTPQQGRLAQMSPEQAPLLLSLNASMLYVGTALGAAIGGPAAQAWGFGALAWFGVPIALAAWAFLQAGPRLAFRAGVPN